MEMSNDMAPGIVRIMMPNEKEEKKKFLCFWGDGYVGNPEMIIIREDFFLNMRGYSLQDIREILALDYGELWKSHFHQEEHYVIRIKE
jgi:hypothetical protein